jgi:hypothetical protein
VRQDTPIDAPAPEFVEVGRELLVRSDEALNEAEDLVAA